jgi:hypothetical protein
MLPSQLRDEALIELENLEIVASDATELITISIQRALTKHEVYAVAAILGCFYTGAENLFVRFLKNRNAKLPTGDKWHEDLLGLLRTGEYKDDLFEFDDETIKTLHDLRKIRHVVRNRYGHLLQWELLAPHLKNLPRLATSLKTSVNKVLNIYKS